MSQQIDQSKKSFTAFDQASTLIAVVELSSRSWLVPGIVPGVERHPLKKLEADETRLLALLRQWRQLARKLLIVLWRMVTTGEVSPAMTSRHATRPGYAALFGRARRRGEREAGNGASERH